MAGLSLYIKYIRANYNINNVKYIFIQPCIREDIIAIYNIYNIFLHIIKFFFKEWHNACQAQGSEVCGSSPASYSLHELLPFKSVKIRGLRVKESFPLKGCSACPFLNFEALETSVLHWTVLKMKEKFRTFPQRSTVQNARSYLILSIHRCILNTK